MKGESGWGGFEGRVSGVSRRDCIFLESRWRRQVGVRFLLYAVVRGESADILKRSFTVEYRVLDEVELRILFCRCLRLGAEIRDHYSQ